MLQLIFTTTVYISRLQHHITMTDYDNLLQHITTTDHNSRKQQLVTKNTDLQ